jgi:hypothetical protein
MKIRIVAMSSTIGAWKWHHGALGRYRVALVEDNANKLTGHWKRSKSCIAVLWESRKLDFGTQRRPSIAWEAAKTFAEQYAKENNILIEED